MIPTRSQHEALAASRQIHACGLNFGYGQLISGGTRGLAAAASRRARQGARGFNGFTQETQAATVQLTSRGRAQRAQRSGLRLARQSLNPATSAGAAIRWRRHADPDSSGRFLSLRCPCSHGRVCISPIPNGTPFHGCQSVFFRHSVPDTAGQFRARFPKKPTESQEPGSIGGTAFIVYFAATATPSPLEVGSEIIGSPLPSAEFQATMRVADGSFASAADFNLKAEVVTQFRGHPARRATFDATNGHTYTFLTFFYSSTRLYFIFAPAGTQFQRISQSFLALA